MQRISFPTTLNRVGKVGKVLGAPESKKSPSNSDIFVNFRPDFIRNILSSTPELRKACLLFRILYTSYGCECRASFFKLKLIKLYLYAH